MRPPCSAVDRLGALDVLLSDAGGGHLPPTHELDDENWRPMQALNIEAYAL